MIDKHWVYRPILDLIGFAEGTDRGRGYNETLAYGAFTGGDVNLVSMTLGQVDALQTRMLRHPANSWNSSAAGRYQIVRTTLRSVKSRMGLSDRELYNEDMQDRLARFLLWDRGIDDYCRGELSEDRMLLELAREWASFPKPNGEGYYSGQGGKLSPNKVRTVLRQVRTRFNSEVPVAKPVEPQPQPQPAQPRPQPMPEPVSAGFPWRTLLFLLVVGTVVGFAIFAFHKWDFNIIDFVRGLF